MLIFLIFVYILLIAFFFESDFLFLNEEFLIFICMILFFFILYKSIHKIVVALIFKKIENIYMVFFYLLNVSIALIDRILFLIGRYKIYVESFIPLEIFDIVFNRLSNFFILENKKNKKIINNDILFLCNKIFLLETYYKNLSYIKLNKDLNKFDITLLSLIKFESLVFDLFLNTMLLKNSKSNTNDPISKNKK